MRTYDGISIKLSSDKEIDATIEAYNKIDKEKLKCLIENFKIKEPQKKPKENYLQRMIKLHAIGVRYELVPYFASILGFKGKINRKKMDDIKNLETEIYGSLISDFESEKNMHFYLYKGVPTYLTGNAIRENYVKILKESLLAHGLKPKNILEVGCGHIQNAKFLTKELQIEYMGFDYSFARVAIGKMLDKKWNVWCGDGTAIPLKDKSIDLCFTAHVLERMGNQTVAMLKEIARVSKFYTCFEPVYEHQNLFGKIHNRKCDYPRNLKKAFAEARMEIVEEIKTDTGAPFNLSTFYLLKCPR